MQLGLVTYNWGKDWDLPTLIKNCEEAGYAGVELRSTHKHGVEPSLSREMREEVAMRFADSKVELVGLGTACEYHAADPAELKKQIAETHDFIRLCHDLGAGGIKVRPNGFPQGVPVERTIEQIGKSLKAVAEYAAGFGVEIRLEVHGHGTQELPNIKRIMDVANDKLVGVCWNCNPADLAEPGLKHNFDLVKDRLGRTVHIHDVTQDNYPWKEFFGLLKQARYDGWTLVEEGKVPEDIVGAMIACRKKWEELTQ